MMNWTTLIWRWKKPFRTGSIKSCPGIFAHHNCWRRDGTPFEMGSTNAYTEDATGNPVYNWRITDSIFDTHIRRGMNSCIDRFYAWSAFVKSVPYRHYWNRVLPIEKYSSAGPIRRMIIRNGARTDQWVKHCVECYGKKEVELVLEEWTKHSYWQGTGRISENLWLCCWWCPSLIHSEDRRMRYYRWRICFFKHF